MSTVLAPSLPSAHRTDQALVAATRPYAREDRLRSWLYTLSTMGALGGAAWLAASQQPWPVRAAAAVATGLAIVRAFVLFHDFMHQAILRGSRLAWGLYSLFGLLILVPPSVWRETHNYHHAHTAKIVGSHVGSFPMVTTTMWAKMTSRQRLAYRLARHPLTMLFAYLTVFLWGMVLAPLIRAPRRHGDAALSLVVHAAFLGALAHVGGGAAVLFGAVLPMSVACAAGAYLFYAQHNFPGVHVADRAHWRFADAALRSSSYLRLGFVGRVITANIGFHHVHHLNAAIPFYRLPEAMAAIPELATPTETSLHPRDVLACLRLALWDATADRMVPLPRDPLR